MLIAEYRLYLDNKTGRTKLRRGRILERDVDSVIVNRPNEVYGFMQKTYHLYREPEEKAYLLCVNAKTAIIGVFHLSSGAVNATIVSPRSIYQRALLVGATNIILVHNHPSQDVTPSQDDIASTKRLLEVGKLLGVNLLDHIIIGQSYYSFKESDLLK